MQVRTVNNNKRYEPELPRSFMQNNDIDPSQLSPFQRILLIADGTLTKILEAYLSENIQIVKLGEYVTSIAQDIPPLDIQAGREVVKRKILLQGQKSGKNWLYAESTIVLDRLEKKFRKGLLESHVPIGKLWLRHKTETFKEIIVSAKEAAGNLADYFDIEKEDKLLYRTYRVFSDHKPVMMITEKFPESYFVLMPRPFYQEPAPQ